MGKKEKKEKKPAGKLKKIIIFSIVFLILGGGILGIVLAVTTVSHGDATNALNKLTNASLVVNEEDKSNFNTLKGKITNNEQVKYYSTEITDVYSIMSNIDVMLNFYNDYYCYAKSCKARDRHNKVIRNSANETKDIQKDMSNVLKDALDKTKSTQLQNAWVDFRKNFSLALEQYSKMFAGLDEVFENGMGNSLVVNNASVQILNCATDYIAILSEGFSDLAEKDLQGNLGSKYSYLLTNKVSAFNSFVNEYIKDRTYIENYYFITSIQTDFDSVALFKDYFKEQSFKALLDKITIQGGVITSSYSGASPIVGSSTVLANVKLFIKGAL